MERNKVIYAGETLIDLTADTVTPETLLLGVTAHDKSGTIIAGTYEGSEWTSGIYIDEDGYLRVSPLAAAGGIYMEDGYIVVADRPDTPYPDGDYLGYGAKTYAIVDEGTVGTSYIGSAIGQAVIGTDVL